ncbi:MAG: 4-amino-4-deoxy-L-arabinose transferase-like glycosyltransferase, partial [Saprospiraceae bacterium]
MTVNQTVKYKWTQFFLVIFISFVSIYGINRLNIEKSIEGGARIRLEKTVKTADDVSYLLPAKNYLNNKGWNDGSPGLQGNYMRSPGYGLFCLPFFATLEESTALLFIRTTQCLLIALAAGLLFMLLLHWGFPNLLAFFSAAFLGILPSFSGYVFYTLTEGLTPVLLFLLFALYAFSKLKYYQSKRWGLILIYLIACAVFGFIFITRPVFGTFALLLLSIFLKIKTPLVKKVQLSILGLILAFGPTVLWEYRNHNLGKEIKGISTFYEI